MNSRQQDTSTQVLSSPILRSLAQPHQCAASRTKARGPRHPGQLELSFRAQHHCPLGRCLHLPSQLTPEIPTSVPLARVCVCSGSRPTLLGCTARRRFSIHLSRSAADRHEKHLLPDDVVTCGGWAGQCHRGGEHSKASMREDLWALWDFSCQFCATATGRGQNKAHNDHVCR